VGARATCCLSNVDWPRYTTLSLADAAATVRLPQGDALTVRVVVDGPMPDQVFVDYAFAGGETGSEALSRTGEREFTWTIDAVLADMQLSMQGGDALPLPLTVTVVERPRIEDLVGQGHLSRTTWSASRSWCRPTEGELRLPKGAWLSFAGKSHKALDEAFALFGNEQKVPLRAAPTASSFAGDFSPPPRACW
jgi:hypothetical protein